MTIFNRSAFRKLLPKEIDFNNFKASDVVHLMKFVYKKFLCPTALAKGTKKFSSFVYKHSFSPALMMIFFNSFGIISSHLSQINGLRKSNRENKDYLINQEKKELFLDSLLTVIPPFIINRLIGNKFKAGKWASPEQLKLLETEISAVTGTVDEDFYAVMPLSFRETFTKFVENTKEKIKDSNYFTQEFKDKIEIHPGVKNKKIPGDDLENIFLKFDNIMKGQAPKMRNGFAYDEFMTCRSGIITIATLAYTMVAMSIIMPILKNKLANNTYKKELARIGETPESIRRKKRFAYNENPVYNTNSGLFSSLSHNVSSTKKDIHKQNLDVISKNSQYIKKNTVFSDFAITSTSSLKV